MRNLLKSKVHAAINIISLAIGIACCLVILLFVMQERSYDRFHANIDNIYRVLSEIKSPDGSKRTVAIEPLPLAGALKDEFPEVVRVVRFNDFRGAVRYDDKVFTERLILADPGVFEMFSFRLLSGNRADVLADPTAVVISERVAEKYFDGESAQGKQLSITIDNNPQDFVVTGVVQNIANNSSIKFDFLLPFVQTPGYARSNSNWGASSCVTYVQLLEGHSGVELESKLQPFIEKYFGDRIESGRESGAFSLDSDAWQLFLQPFADVHLATGIRWGLEPTGNPVYSYILTAIGLITLLIACANFITLSLAGSARRAKEVGMRKVMGAARKELIKQYWGESLLLSFFALMVGVLLAELFMPTFNKLANTQVNFDIVSIPLLVIFLAALMLLISLIAGGYPAILLSKFQPIAVFNERLKLGGKTMLGKSLVVFQFLLSIFLITSTLLMSQQLHFLRHKDLGYNADQVLAIPTYTLGEQQEQISEIYKNEIARNNQVLHISGVNNSFTRGRMTSDVRSNSNLTEAWFYIVKDDFLKTLEIQLIQGRDFSTELQTDQLGSVIVNEALVEYFGWDDPIGRQLEILGGYKPVIIGVARNFHFQSLHNRIEPSVILLQRDWSNANILVKISRADIAGTLAFLEESWKKIAPLAPFEFYFFDEEVQKQYLAEERWTNIVGFASILAVVIACLGLFGLTALATTQRKKEIGLRKVLGATSASVVALLSKDFVRLVLIANLLAWPAAWFVMSRWLQNFAYRIEVSWWIFILSGGLTVIIALITISSHAIRTALANPVDSLKYE